MTAYLRGVSYVLGEEEVGYAGIARLPELAAAFRLVPNPGLWGWGTVRVTRREVADLAADAARATLAAAGVDRADALVLCSTRFPAEHGAFVAAVLTRAGLGDIPFYGQGLNQCVNLLAALDIARSFVLSGRYRTVLVVTADAVGQGDDPMSPFALFSDGAAGCLVAADPGAEAAASYEILGCAAAQYAADLDGTGPNGTAQISSDLAREVNERLLAPLGLKLGDVTALAHLNLFKPLLVMKERQAGCREDQLYLDNIGRIGHCFSADPLINLSDRDLVEGQYCLLAASVPGSRIGVLVQKVR
jgi:3-oxoacyl-[acyl-carrier-protein] synthase-3